MEKEKNNKMYECSIFNKLMEGQNKILRPSVLLKHLSGDLGCRLLFLFICRLLFFRYLL